MLRNGAFIIKNVKLKILQTMVIFINNICNTLKTVFLCKSFTFQDQIKIIKTYKYLNKHDF